MKDAPIIFVMERGFCIVGRIADESTLEITLDDVSVIRIWGTENGLGELAMKGPLSNTRLDREPNGTIINKLCCYRRLPCDAAKWDKYPREQK